MMNAVVVYGSGVWFVCDCCKVAARGQTKEGGGIDPPSGWDVRHVSSPWAPYRMSTEVACHNPRCRTWIESP